MCDGAGIESRTVNNIYSTRGHRGLPAVTRKRYSVGRLVAHAAIRALDSVYPSVGR